MMSRHKTVWRIIPLVIVIACLLGLTEGQGCGTVTECFPHSEKMNNDYDLYWKVVGNKITFEVHVLTTGWVGLGLSRDTWMPDSDVVTGWVTGGVASLLDRYTTGRFLPPIDVNQDYTLLEGKEENGCTILKFSRDVIISGIDQFDYQLHDGDVNVLYAYGSSDVVSYHGRNKGVKQIELLRDVPATDKGACTPALEQSLDSSCEYEGEDAGPPVVKRWGCPTAGCDAQTCTVKKPTDPCDDPSPACEPTPRECSKSCGIGSVKVDYTCTGRLADFTCQRQCCCIPCHGGQGGTGAPPLVLCRSKGILRPSTCSKP